MSLVDLYVEEIGRHLPAKNREDLQREIRSLVEDALEDAAQRAGYEANEDLVMDVLKKFGAPQKVAASYQPPRYLIGPNLYPTFLLVIRIVIPVIAVLSAVGLGVALGRTAADWTAILQTVGAEILGFLGSSVAALGNVVLVFAIIQWLTPDLKFDDKPWDPRSLEVAPDPDLVKPAGQVVEIFFNLSLILVMNFYSQWIGITMNQNGKWLHAPLLTPAFYAYLPWINLILAAAVILNVLVIRQGCWNRFLRLYSIAMNVACILLTVSMLSGPSFMGLNSTSLIQDGWEQGMVSVFKRVLPVLTRLFRLSLIIVLVIQVVDLFRKLYRMIASKITPPSGSAQ